MKEEDEGSSYYSEGEESEWEESEEEEEGDKQLRLTES